MTVIGTIQTFNEAGNIGDAVASLFEVGCGRVFVLDGAWLDTERKPFGGGALVSSDGTAAEARAAGAEVLVESNGCPGGDAGKQQLTMHSCGALPGDFVFRLDADERARGTLPDLEGDALVWLHNHGENDIPAVRSVWPRGDDYHLPIPMFRLFAYRADLRCDRPGRWRTDEGTLEPYRVGALRKRVDELGLAYADPIACEYRDLRDREHLLPPAETAAFPILDGVWIDHYRDGSKAAAKTVYYEAVA